MKYPLRLPFPKDYEFRFFSFLWRLDIFTLSKPRNIFKTSFALPGCLLFEMVYKLSLFSRSTYEWFRRQKISSHDFSFFNVFQLPYILSIISRSKVNRSIPGIDARMYWMAQNLFTYMLFPNNIFNTWAIVVGYLGRYW